jgi:hypothetical protein
MIINSAPQNEAILSNVSEIGEFRIRNSAKAFNILSSGLYANKVRAIIRELSCNAVDSHTAAGKQDTPFDVHLPNTLEPWFAIRDYGTGLSHEQVTNIYTTYFESTKTNSNDFIGALGLGSKSPFSYTDNFTVTAIKDGVKGIYSAFINEAGVPSIAKMGDEQTTEPTGVEVKFSVSDRYDFSKFQDEARQVYTYFKLRPVITGVDFKFRDVEYESENIIPGVHQYRGSGRSVAIMGNIAYPVEVPNADQSLGDLRGLLNCGLEMHFDIGELDFQASREGLSYIPQTVESIKRKLESINAVLATKLAAEADAVPNLWDRAVFLQKRKDNQLWTAAVKKYAVDSALPTFDVNRYGGTMTFKMGIEDLAKKYNISIRGFNYQRNSKAYPNKKHDTEYSEKKNANNHYDMLHYWGITVSNFVHFVINDTKVGAVERAKYHYRETAQDTNNLAVYVLDAVDKTKPMKTKAFFAAMHNPRTEVIFNVSSFVKKERAGSGLGKNVTILRLEERNNGGYYRSKEMVWRDAGKVDGFDATETYYYLPLSGFNVQSNVRSFDAKSFYNDLKDSGIETLKKTVYGVRKSDIEFIKTQRNWVNIETYVAGVLAKVDTKLVMSLVLSAIDNQRNLDYNVNIADKVTNTNSPYLKLVKQFEGYDKVRYNEQSLKRLCSNYAPGTNFSPEAVIEKFKGECSVTNERYPLLKHISGASSTEVAEYINLIDTQKGV